MVSKTEKFETEIEDCFLDVMEQSKVMNAGNMHTDAVEMSQLMRTVYKRGFYDGYRRGKKG